MRSSYGKLVYLLQDSEKPEIQNLLEFSCVTKIKTVYTVLKGKKNGLQVLSDPLVNIAIREIKADNKARNEIEKEIKAKEHAVKTLSYKYATKKPKNKKKTLYSSIFRYTYPEDSSDSDVSESDLSVDEIEQCLHSLADHNTYLRYNMDPVEQLIKYLEQYFKPDEYEPHFSLAIAAGRSGARLTHNHQRQYLYVKQTLVLWREVLKEMFVLWKKAEDDLLNPFNRYALRDTGQGLNRVQHAPELSKVMGMIVNRTQSLVGQWVGSSVVHLGDHNVPNALMFIDKYTQVPRVVTPLVLVLDRLESICVSASVAHMINSDYGSVTNCRKHILTDFFRHAFDGSGADSFFDAGSCIDGRLTSAWNWCSRVEKKDYFNVFLLTGFTGFDGKF
eukprot:GHVR01184486.1.p1 GENE.GHVR01184486.1~~GHVR01184486.1.p1  ORF type:complete len:389 (+),score=68.52 GHVR01184486.1:784-1950(+)